MLQNHIPGFTLAELLIALAILGEIAASSIPKIVSAQQNGQRIAVFKETIGALSAITYQGYLQGELTTGNIANYYGTQLNAIKICPNNAFTEGYWTHTGGNTEPGFVLHNGATLSGFNNTGPGNGLFMDWNGATGPNIEGQDITQLQLCIGSPCWYGVRAGTIWYYSATSGTM